MKFKFTFKRNKEKASSNIGGKKTREYLNPMRDWLIILGCAVLVFIGGVVFISLDFYHQLDARTEAVSTESQPLIYAEKDVIEYAKIYSKKEELFNTLRNDKSLVPPVEPTTTKEEDESTSSSPDASAPSLVDN